VNRSAALLAVPLVLSLWAASIPQAWAKCWTVSGHTFCDNREAAGNRGGGGSGTTSTAPTGPSPEQLRQDRARQRLRAQAWYTDEAMDYFDRKDWDNAIRSFEEALDRAPDDPDLNEWLKRAQAEKEKSRRPVVAAPRPAPDNDSRVVDARGVPQPGADLLAKIPELQKSPAAEHIRKGYQALLNRDWQVTLAWWQEALALDPGNAALKRSVDLAKWMVDRQKEVRPGAVTLFNAANAAAKRGDFDSALELLQRLKSTNPAMAAPAERMAEAVRARRAREPQISDLEAFFPSPYTAVIEATTKADYSGAIALLGQVNRTHPDLARTTDVMISNVKLLALPVQLPDPEDVKLLFPERAYAAPMTGSGLELLADGYAKKAQQVFDRARLRMAPKEMR
jgi:tetratricopeptide (TPR) repeat protein